MSIDLKTQEMLDELRERGLYLLVIGPGDFMEYELEDGKVPMTEKEALQLIARAKPAFENLLMEDVWQVVEDFVRQHKKETEQDPKE